MRRTRLRALVGAACAIAALLAAVPASAEPPQSTPGGPWSQPNQNESLSAIRDYDELVATLERMVASSHGTAQLSYPTFAANSGRKAPIVTIGALRPLLAANVG